jgi:hypothetical protein
MISANSAGDALKPFIQVLLATGHLYEIPTLIVAKNRAAAMLELHPNEFEDLDAAMRDSEELFEDNAAVRDWALNNMNVEELMKEARLVRFTPPEPDFEGAEWSYHDAKAVIPQLDAETILSTPVELALSAMAAHNNICQLVPLLNNGQPYAAIALVQGGPGIVGMYVGALTHLTNTFVAKAAGEAPAAPN